MQIFLILCKNRISFLIFMKKHLLISTLLLIVAYNLVGFMAAFQAIRSEWRQSVRSELGKVAKNDLVRFVFAKEAFDISKKEKTEFNKFWAR